MSVFDVREDISEILAAIRKIIRELESISPGVRSNFDRIGEDKCSNALETQIDKYRSACRKLEEIQSNYNHGDFSSGGGGGGSGGGGGGGRF